MIPIDAETFQRPRSVRLELGFADPDGYYERHYDLAALRRELLDPLGPGGDRRYLPTLWDPDRDRATRAGYRYADPRSVVVVRGWLLLRLPFDLTVHLALSDGALARRARAAREAVGEDPGPVEGRDRVVAARYRREQQPEAVADVVVLCDHPQRPAVIDRLR